MSKMCKIYYLLNEEGRKKSLLSNGDGKELQCVEAPITKELLDLEAVRVNSDGNATFKVAHGSYKSSNTMKKAVIQTIGCGGSFKLGDKYYYKPTIDYKYETAYFSDLKTADELIKYEKDRLFNLKKSKEEIQEEYEVLLKEYNDALEEYKKEQERLEKIKLDEKERKETEAKLNKIVEQKDDEKWILTKGSDYLKQCLKLGYNCRRKYMEERVEKDFPGFELDFDDEAGWKDRVSPSQEALDEVIKWIDLGYDAKIVWLTDSVHGSDYDYENDFEPCEAITFKFKDYYLVKQI